MKQKLSVTIEEETLKMIEKALKSNTFRNKSHLVDYGLNKFLTEVNQKQ
ncbi:hypothetical protein J4416_01515 [Candidatus Pacearchaeota archaeon]|nr:hypothetical protein [uncultured archaeon]AQS34478.1 hypothetical protein [uncultured archaeon]MBS3081600.1 hypothetical protein [Candidatus Pacearchaeota archaeon]